MSDSFIIKIMLCNINYIYILLALYHPNVFSDHSGLI